MVHLLVDLVLELECSRNSCSNLERRAATLLLQFMDKCSSHHNIPDKYNLYHAYTQPIFSESRLCHDIIKIFRLFGSLNLMGERIDAFIAFSTASCDICSPSSCHL